jgi:hypothetical protein
VRSGPGAAPPDDRCKRCCKPGVSINPVGRILLQSRVLTEPDATGPRRAAIGPHDAPPHAAQVVRRVLLRRDIVIDAETALLVAAAVQAALQAGAPSRPLRRGPRVPAAGCQPLFR